MNRRNRHEPYYPYKNLKDMWFDNRQPTPEQKEYRALTVQTNQAIQKHENAIAQLKQEVQQAFDFAHNLDAELRQELTNVLQPMGESIAQLEADMRIDPEFPEVTILGVLRTHEQDINELYALIGAQRGYAQSAYKREDPPTPKKVVPQKIVDAEHENPNPNIITHPNPNPNPNPNHLRKRVAITQEQFLIIQANYKRIPHAEIADACDRSIKWLEAAISQLKQDGKL